jgi:glycosyltransferase involved in cell wall biosynthesis
MNTNTRQHIALSVVAPAHNEQDNITPLTDQIEDALLALAQRFPTHFPNALESAEFILVDDGSTDDTQHTAKQLAQHRPWLRVIATADTPPNAGNGQSAAFHAGFRAARGTHIATLDADLQNDPADLPNLYQTLLDNNAHMAQGDRSHARRDNAVRRYGSAVGRTFRKLLLNDTIRDTGCSLRIMHRDIALALPLEFKGMHRFIPATARHLGYTVVEQPVNHRPRTAGTTKYGMGITKRAIPGLIDCLAVRWMHNRRKPTNATNITPPPAQGQRTNQPRTNPAADTTHNTTTAGSDAPHQPHHAAP